MTAQTTDHSAIAAEVLTRINGWPETYRQGRWLRLADGREGTTEDLLEGKTASAWSECGTTACAAGHIAAVALANDPGLINRPSTQTGFYAAAGIATKAMGLTERECNLTRPWIFESRRNREEVLDWLEAVAAGENPQTASDRLEALAAAGTG